MTDDERAVHPSAAIFPRLSGDELRELADDIKANGLHHPIVLDSDERIVDGINRYMACEIAGVEPTFITLPVNTDIVAYIVSENVRRRNMSKGQLAMAIAALIDTEEGKRDGQTKTLRLESNLSRAHITQAVTIRRYASDLAPAVLAGTETFDAAYRAATARKRQQEDAARRRSARRARTLSNWNGCDARLRTWRRSSPVRSRSRMRRPR